MNSNKARNECITCSSISLFTILGFLFMGFMFDSLMIMMQHHETTCYIVDTITPYNLPTESNNWITCDCGRNCKSYSPCSKIYVNISDGNSDVLILESTMRDMRTNTICTFSNDECYMQQIWELNHSMYRAIKKMEYYNELENSSTPLKCYTNSDKTEAFLENHIPLKTVLLLTIPFFFSMMWCCYALRNNFKEMCGFSSSVHPYNEEVTNVKTPIKSFVTSKLYVKNDESTDMTLEDKV